MKYNVKHIVKQSLQFDVHQVKGSGISCNSASAEMSLKDVHHSSQFAFLKIMYSLKLVKIKGKYLRRMTGGYVFTGVCPGLGTPSSSHNTSTGPVSLLGGTPVPDKGGTPVPDGGYPISGYPTQPGIVYRLAKSGWGTPSQAGYAMTRYAVGSPPFVVSHRRTVLLPAAYEG